MLTAKVVTKAIRHEAEAHIYARGVDYFRRGYVKNVVVGEAETPSALYVTSDVHGSDIYEVELGYDVVEEAFTEMECTCPYDDGVCKHVIATALALADQVERNKVSVSLPTSVPTTQDASEKGAQEEKVRAALRDLGLSAEDVPSNLIEQLLQYKKPPTPSLQSRPNWVLVEPIQKPAAPIAPKHTAFNPKEYRIALKSYNGYAPTFASKNSWGKASIAKVLARTDLTPAQRELLTYIKDGRFENVQSPPPDVGILFPLLAASGIPVNDNVYSYNDRRLAIDINPKPLQAEIVHAPLPMYADETRVRHDFFLRMPEEYWKRRDAWHDSPFFVQSAHLVHDTDRTLALHNLTPLLAGVLARVVSTHVYDHSDKVIRRYQTQLTGDEVARFDELVADASQLFSLTTPPPHLTLQKEDAEPHPAFVVDFDNSAQTLRIIPVVDYGMYRQDISESVYVAHRAGGDALGRRAPFEHQGTHIVTVSGESIRCAKVDQVKEGALYTELVEQSDVVGFTRTLKCLRRGARPVAEYIRDHWPKLSTYARKKGYPIIFTRDALATEQATFRADFKADVNADNDWLYFDVACYCGDERVTLEKLLAYVHSGEAFWRKDDGMLVEIANKHELERLARLLQGFHAAENGGYEGRLYNASELEYVMTSSPHYSMAQAKSFKDFLARMQEGKPLQKVKLPTHLSKKLRPYQKAGIEWMYFLRSHRFAGILAYDMGLGKTLQTLSVLHLEKVAGKPSIVICPKTLLYNWKQEAEKFFPDLKVLVYDGTPTERKALRKKIKHYDVIVMSYNTLKQDEDIFTKSSMKFNYAVLDEAQCIKNHATKNAQIVKKLNAEYRLALTGTPLENNVSEVWSMYDFLMPGFLGSYEHFAKRFHKPIMDEGDKHTLEHLRRKVSGFMLRRTKSEVAKDLPQKIEQMSQCHLSAAQNILYQQILTQVRGDVFGAVKAKGFKSAQIHILAGLTKLRQACNHPALLVKESNFRTYESAKLDMCMELVDEIATSRRKVLIFSQFTQMLDIVAAALKDRGVPYAYLSGKTKNRQTLVNTFNTDPTVPVFLISLKAGGTGLNLTSADTVIIFDPWWNPSVENQAIDRAHRIGQNKTVNVYRLLTTGTIEEKIQALKKKKQNLFDALVGESGDQFKKLTWDDVRELFAE